MTSDYDYDHFPRGCHGHGHSQWSWLEIKKHEQIQIMSRAQGRRHDLEGLFCRRSWRYGAWSPPYLVGTFVSLTFCI